MRNTVDRARSATQSAPALEGILFKSILFVFASVLFVFAQANAPAAPSDVRTADNALLPIPGAVLYNNVYDKGDVTNYKQSVFHGKGGTGWEWDWPESGGSSLRVYPEVLVGQSPWSDAGGLAGAAGLRAGDQLPRLLSDMHLAIDFDFSTVASGLWFGSFDFWITSSDHPTSKDTLSNLTIWTINHGVTNKYKGPQKTLKIGGRTYEAIFETPKDQPDKAWPTVCLVDTEPRSEGSLELGQLVEAVIANALTKPTDFLATAELDTEMAYGKGRTTLRACKLR